MAAHDHPIVAAVLVAAGSGSRLGADVPKAFVRLAGRSLLEHAAARFLNHPRVHSVVVVAPAPLVESAGKLVPRATVVAGGASRQQSVRRGLRALTPGVDLVLVHDVARAFVPAAVIDRVIDGACAAGAAVPVLPVVDTLRSVAGGGLLGAVVDRDGLAATQTPQGFARELLERAHAEATAEATDDAALVQALGGTVAAVPGDARAFKVTVPLDLVLAEALLARFGDALEDPWWDDARG
jgi:2-C-methyl-D-erythritol 4-phosphate cytidylyltransferase